MSLLVTFNGANYIIPQDNEVGWGSNLDDYFVAIAAGCLQKSGGVFTLTAETDFGATYGLKSAYYKTRASNIAATGAFRLANAETGIVWRNSTNSGDLALTVNSSNQLTFNGIAIESNTLTNGHVWIGNASNIATDTAITGDVAITNAGVSSVNNVQAGVITNTMVNASAAIALSKLAALSTGKALQSNASTGLIEVSSVTSTELGYLSGVTSAIQTQLGTKIDTAGTGLTKTTTTLSLTAPVTVALGGTGQISLTAYAVLCGGTTSTGALQQVSGVGSSGQVLTSNGVSALPTWQNVTGSGTVNSGTAGRLTLYATSTNAVSDTYVQNANNIGVAIASHAALAATRTYTIPDAGASASFHMTEGATTVNGALTLTAALAITPTTNQLVLGTTRTLTITAPTPATSSRTWTIPDITGNGTFAALEGTQTFTGTKTFSDLRGTLGANLAAGSNKITGLAAGSTSGDSVRYEQVVLAAGSTMTGNLAFDSSSHGITGASGAAVPAAGLVGEVLSATGTPTAVSTAVTNLVSLSITAGVWMLVGTFDNNGAVASNTYFNFGITQNSGSLTGTTEGVDRVFAAINAGNGGCSLIRFINQSSTTTWYVAGQSSNGSSTYTGSLRALRIA